MEHGMVKQGGMWCHTEPFNARPGVFLVDFGDPNVDKP